MRAGGDRYPDRRGRAKRAFTIKNLLKSRQCDNKHDLGIYDVTKINSYVSSRSDNTGGAINRFAGDTVTHVTHVTPPCPGSTTAAVVNVTRRRRV